MTVAVNNATPAPASAPAATPAAATAPATPAPATSQAPTQQAGGFLDHIKLPEGSPADNKQAPAAPAAGAAPETPPAAAGTTPEPEAGKPTPVVFKTTIRGREFTGEELAKAYEHSTTEALRLKDSEKQHQQRATAAEAKITELLTKLDETPPFQVLTKEQLKELDPADQVDYAVKKNAWETRRDSRKEQLAKVQETQKAQAQETKNYIYSRTEHMLSNATEFPGYKDLMPVMEQILDRVPSLAGMRETPDVLYYAALGLQKYREGKVSQSAEEKARQEAAATAQAQAAAAGGGNPPAPVAPTPPVDDDSDEAFNKRVLAKAQKGIFTQ